MVVLNRDFVVFVLTSTVHANLPTCPGFEDLPLVDGTSSGPATATRRRRRGREPPIR